MYKIADRERWLGVLVGLLLIWIGGTGGAALLAFVLGMHHLVPTMLLIAGIGICAWFLALGITAVINNIN